MRNRLQNKLQYEAKAAELRKLTEIEAKKLQDVLDEGITAKNALSEQVERKARLNREITDLNEKIRKATEEVGNVSEQLTTLLGKASKEFKEEREKLGQLRKEIQEELKGLDGTKTNLNDLYGKVATYVKKAEETLKYVNEEIKKTGVPINFEPINISLKNFTEILNV